MLPYFRDIMSTVWAVIGEGFSSATIIPGITTTDDVVWWFREKIRELGYDTWFQTSVNVFRRGVPTSFSGIIQRGDMIWCDIGFSAFNLHTDTQHVGYVLRENETDVPQGFKNGLGTANTMQDILMRQIQVGRTGNEVLASSRAEMTSRGINGTFYSHPVNDYGHGSGPLIGYVNIQTPSQFAATSRLFPPCGTRSSCRPQSRSRSGATRPLNSGRRRTCKSTPTVKIIGSLGAKPSST